MELVLVQKDELEVLFKTYFESAVAQLALNTGNVLPIIVTGEELAKRLGVTVQTLIRWRKKGKIPYLEIGSAIRYNLQAVTEALTISKGRRAS